MVNVYHIVLFFTSSMSYYFRSFDSVSLPRYRTFHSLYEASYDTHSYDILVQYTVFLLYLPIFLPVLLKTILLNIKLVVINYWLLFIDRILFYFVSYVLHLVKTWHFSQKWEPRLHPQQAYAVAFSLRRLSSAPEILQSRRDHFDMATSLSSLPQDQTWFDFQGKI